MKIIKSLLAMALVLAVVMSMAVPAFAATKEEAYEAAVNSGAPNHHLAELKNYLNAVSFTSEEYDLMVKAATRVHNIVNSYSLTLHNVEPKNLTEAQKENVFKSMPYNVRTQLLGTLVSLGNQVGVKVEVDVINYDKGYKITATDKNGKVVTSSSSKPVVDTSVDYTALVVVMSGVLALAVCGVVLVGRKVKN